MARPRAQNAAPEPGSAFTLHKMKEEFNTEFSRPIML